MGLLIESLLITNIWIFLYNSILLFLNGKFPPPLPIGFIQSGQAPEPFEIIVYIILTVISVFFIYLAHQFFFKKNTELPNKLTKVSLLVVIKFAFLLGLIWLFITNIGNYPMKSDISPYSLRPNGSIYLTFFAGYIITLVIICLELFILKKILAKNHNKLLLGIIFLTIAVVLFEPRFPILAHDYSFFYGPTLDVAGGKTIYTQVQSQYGFLPIIFLASFYKIGLFKLSYLPIIIWLFYTIEYFILFFLVSKISRSFPLALIALSSAITLNYFSGYISPINFPQGGPLRWLPMLLILVAFYFSKKFTSKKLIFLISTLSLWFIDGGIYIIMSYLTSLFYFFLKKDLKIAEVVKSIFWLFIFIIADFLVINLCHLFLGLPTINILLAFTKIQQYAKDGMAMLPIDLKTYAWLVILIYFTSAIYYFRKQKINFIDNLLIFSANISFFSSLYYVGRSHPANLFLISIMFFFNLFILLSIAYQKIPSLQLRLLFLVILFLALVIYPSFNRKEVLTEMLLNRISRFKSQNIFKSEMDEKIYHFYTDDKQLINNNISDSEIVILFIDATYLYYMTGKTNMLQINPQSAILTENDLEFALKKVTKLCPHTIAADCRLFNKCQVNSTYTELKLFLQPKILSQIENVCHLKYEPTKCTGHICIAKKI